MNVISFFAHRKSMALPSVIFMKLTNAHKHYAQIFYTKFYPDHIVNV